VRLNATAPRWPPGGGAGGRSDFEPTQPRSSARHNKLQIRECCPRNPTVGLGQDASPRSVDFSKTEQAPPFDPHRAGFFVGDQSSEIIRLLIRQHRDDPTRGTARPIFHHRPDHPRDSRSRKGQRCFFASVLGVPAASRFFWIGRFDYLHDFTKGRGTQNSFRNPSSKYQRNIKQ
jgi:hypothetical protein